MPKTSHKVVIVAQAQRNMRDASEYLRRQLKSPHAARAFIAECRQKIKLVASMPLGFPTDAEVFIRAGYAVRRIIVRHYKILYRFDEVQDAVVILAVRHEREDLANAPYLEFDSSEIHDI